MSTIIIKKSNIDGKEVTKCNIDVGLQELSDLLLDFHKQEFPMDTLTSTDTKFMIMRAIAESRNDPSGWRDDRHTLISRKTKDGLHNNHSILVEVYDKYGPRSVLLNTLARAVSMRKLTDLEIKKATKNFTPPAFDIALRYDREVPINLDAKFWVEHWKDVPGLKKIIKEIRKARDFYANKYLNTGAKRIMILDNNSKQGYTIGTVEITDTMANLYTHPKLIDRDMNQELSFHHLCDLVGIKNSREETDPFAYIMVDDQFDKYKFKIVVIADKDGKYRIIYQGCAEIQTISKGIHEMMDMAARRLPGNYTYNQRDWLKNISDKGWFKTKHIVCTDISKFSDTLDREFMWLILKQAGFTEDELRELDLLYSLPVMNIDGQILGDYLYGVSTLASYQGQYGDFPLITICNLCCQAIVMHLLEEPFDDEHNAAVGDDTGFVFDRVHEDSFEVIQNVYGSVGMRINQLKTGELKMGDSGVIDFVKLRADKDGIIPFIEIKPYMTKDFDQVIRDIFDSIFLTNEQKFHAFRVIFDDSDEVIDYLKDVSVINGGINFRIIEERDIDELLERKIQLSDLNNIQYGSFYTWINQTTKTLNKSGLRWSDTVFSELKEVRDKKDELKRLYDDNQITADDYKELVESFIPVAASKVAEVGSKYSISDYRNLIGKDPKIIYENHKMKMKHREYDPEIEKLYELIKENDSWLGRLKKKRKHSRDVYRDKIKSHIEGQSEKSLINISMDINKKLISFDSLQDYTDNVIEAAKLTNAYRIVTILKSHRYIYSVTNGAGTFYYLKLRDQDGIEQRYSLFTNVDSIRPRLPEEVFNKIPIFSGYSNIQELFDYYNRMTGRHYDNLF